jgi:hypothetical protein
MTRITLHDDDGPSVDGVFLPLDVAQVSEEVARVVGAAALEHAETARGLMRLGRSQEQTAAGYAAIAAIAAALAEEG